MWWCPKQQRMSLSEGEKKHQTCPSSHKNCLDFHLNLISSGFSYTVFYYLNNRIVSSIDRQKQIFHPGWEIKVKRVNNKTILEKNKVALCCPPMLSVYSINWSIYMGQEGHIECNSLCSKQKVTSMLNGVLLTLSGWNFHWEWTSYLKILCFLLLKTFVLK